MLHQINSANKVRRRFSDIWEPQLSLPPKKLDFWPKKASSCRLSEYLGPCWLVGCWLWRAGCSYDRASTYFVQALVPLK